MRTILVDPGREDAPMILAVSGADDVAVLVAGILVVVTVVGSAARTVVLPDGRTPRMARATFTVAALVGKGLARVVGPGPRRHLVLSATPAFALLSMPVIWLAGAMAGFTLVFRALEEDGWRAAYRAAGSSLLTLGFASFEDLPGLTAAFLAAAISISILALLIVTYLPTLYSVYSRREAITTAFETSAGEPPEAAELLIRFHVLASPERLDLIWTEWRDWFNESRETHTALPMVVLFRSARADRSWVVTTAAVLDAAALAVSTIDAPYDPIAALCIRSGYLCLRDIATPHGIAFETDPSPSDPISIAREDFDASYDKLAVAGLPLHDREDAWHAFAGWRVNYDSLVVDLARLISVDPPELTKRPSPLPL
jgi:hypothetical protein